MDTVWLIIYALCFIGFVSFIFVIAFGAPFLPTLKPQVKKAIDLIDLKPGQTLLELGSGDGRILNEAAKREIYCVGYELNPLLVIYSLWLTRKNRKYIKIRMRNYWNVKLPSCDGVFVFLLTPYMEKLNKKIENEKQNKVKLVSFAFEIPNKKPSKVVDGLYLYKY
jgi:16S rRNA A1518/A1519 N6-dimethyltransferase RsmA/KsgA/DIM1 with predicted DNA glycosylase/AP lyase activity